MYGEGMAAEYDERLRKLFAEEPKAEEGAELHQAAEKKLLEAYPGILNELFWRGIGARATSAGRRVMAPGSSAPGGGDPGEKLQFQDVRRRYEFAECAFDAMPKEKDMPQIDGEMEAAINYCATTPSPEAQRMRAGFLARWRRRSSQLPPPEAGPCHVDLLEEMLQDLGIRGADTLLRHLRTGCPMSGVVGYEDIYSPGPPGEPEITEGELLRRQPDVLARSRQAIRADSPANKEAIWRSVQKELEAGFMVELQRPPGGTSDRPTPCPAGDDRALADVLELLQDILLTSFNEEKTAEGERFRHLGLVFTITSEGVEVAISAARRRGLVHMLEGVLARDSLSPGEAASLAGKLGFATSALFGRVGRVPLQPIFRRSNAATTFAGFRLGGDLEAALRWWMRTLAEDERCFRKTVPLQLVRPGEGTRYVLLTDACLFGLGAVIATISEGEVAAVEYFAHPVPQQGAGMTIHHLEFVAVTVAFRLWFGDEEDFAVSVWVDNDVVLGSLIQGRTRAKELRAPVHLFWERLARSRGNVWFDRVPGVDNIADLPSRLHHAWAGVPIRGILPTRRYVDQRVVDAAIAEVL
ncbi:hypothetical protein DIPPA_32115 [Diplonema papillatum]|nr:hypothetical protein DIPPA_32115 [Diplonema papillatum]